MTASDVLRHQVLPLTVFKIKFITKGRKPPLHVPIQNTCNLQCNTSADLIKCIEGGTYSREEALVHASVGFDARFGLSLDPVLLPGGLDDLVDDGVQVTSYGGSPVEGGVHLHEVWSKLHSEVAPQVIRVTCTP